MHVPAWDSMHTQRKDPVPSKGWQEPFALVRGGVAEGMGVPWPELGPQIPSSRCVSSEETQFPLQWRWDAHGPPRGCKGEALSRGNSLWLAPS